MKENQFSGVANSFGCSSCAFLAIFEKAFKVCRCRSNKNPIKRPKENIFMQRYQKHLPQSKSQKGAEKSAHRA